MRNENCCEANPKSLIERIWLRLGFGMPIHNDMGDLDDTPGLAASYIRMDIIIHLAWIDRLRLLVSGKIAIKVSTKTDAFVSKAISRSMISVLPISW